jgi:SAM-dependent methyltransferase
VDEGAATGFDNEAYDALQPGMRRSAQALVPIALELVAPRSVIDVGCGRGTWLRVFRELGLEDLYGIDGEHVDRARLEIPAESFGAMDLSRPFRLDRRFDLAISLEVAEHLPKASADGFVESLAALAPAVAFSAAIPDQGGLDHLNEQWPAYWAERFAHHGFQCVDCLRGRLWDRDDVRPWYAQNALLFVTDELRAANRRLRAEHERHGGTPRALVHPRIFKRQIVRLRREAAGSAPGVAE